MDSKVMILENQLKQTMDEIDSVDDTLCNLKHVITSLQSSLAGKASFNDIRITQRAIQEDIALTRQVFEGIIDRVTKSVTTSVTDTMTSSILFRQLRGISQAMGQLAAREIRNRAVSFSNTAISSTALDEVRTVCVFLLLRQLILSSLH
jgi:uncharacterized protein YukE